MSLGGRLYCTEQCNAFHCGEEAHACDVCVFLPKQQTRMVLMFIIPRFSFVQ